MKIIDFIEIGTSNFNTLLQSCSDDEIGISIEPISYYLDSLPNKKNVTKLNYAVTNDRIDDEIEIYYIPEPVIIKNNLPMALRGCNKIGSFHPLHHKFRVKDFVIKEKVRLKNFEEIILENKIDKVKFIKIDTEGHDCIIMESIYKFYNNKDKCLLPEKIIFETNSNSDPSDVKIILEKFYTLGYSSVKMRNDTELILK